MPDATRILIHNDQTDDLVAKLQVTRPDAQVQACNSYDGLPDMIQSFQPQVVYTVRFAGTPGFPRDALFGPNGPQWIANGGAGTDHFGHWDKGRTTVTNAAGVAADMMAEYVFGGFLHFTLDIDGLHADKKAKHWASRTVAPLSGKTILIVGLGNTGQAIAARAKAFGMTVLGTRARPEPMDNVDEVHAAQDLNSLVPRADFIAVSTPLIPATQGLIGAEQIKAMKQGVIFADVSRGGVVDQTALHAALTSGHIAGAALDVFETEPLPQSSPLWSLPNVIISPHCSSVYDGWERASFDLFLQNLKRWETGAELVNIVNPDRGY